MRCLIIAQCNNVHIRTLLRVDLRVSKVDLSNMSKVDLSKVEAMLARTWMLMGGRYVWYNSPLPFSVIFLTYIKNYILFQTFPHLVMSKITIWALFW